MRDLNPEAREELDRLLQTEPNSLTEADTAFLRARSSYLNDEQRNMLKQFDTAKKEEAKEEKTVAEALEDGSAITDKATIAQQQPTDKKVKK
jgi:hypothetical protein